MSLVGKVIIVTGAAITLVGVALLFLDGVHSIETKQTLV
jgi:hypothetical protein